MKKVVQMVREKGSITTTLGLLLFFLLGTIFLIAALGFLFSMLNFLREIFLTPSIKDHTVTVSLILLSLVVIFATIINQLIVDDLQKLIKGD